MNANRRAALRVRQAGFSLVAAIFILVVLALLGAFMLTISQAGRATATGALQGARAYNAAQTGIEFGIYQALNTAPGVACGSPAAVQTGPFPLSGAGLDGFQVTVNCSFTTHQERGDTLQVYSIDSTATFGVFGSPDYFTRSIFVTITGP